MTSWCLIHSHSISWVKKKHPVIDPLVRIPIKGHNQYRSMTVLPYLYELHTGQTAAASHGNNVDGFDEDEEFECAEESLLPSFDQQQQQAKCHLDNGPGSAAGGDDLAGSGGSISRINELTVHSMVSNASKTSKSSKSSNKCKCV